MTYGKFDPHGNMSALKPDQPFFHSKFLYPVVLAAAAILILTVWRLTMHLNLFDQRKLGTTEYDVVYCTAAGVELMMDLYYPDTGESWPVLIFIHGGGWTEGDKNGVETSPREHGYLIASINYRMYPAYRFPAMIEDVKCAIRYLRSHADRYNLDPNRIALMGHSAGGHLAALAGLADRDVGWDEGAYPGVSSRVGAVITVAGPADLDRPYPTLVNELIGNVFGQEQLTSGSPVTYASPDDPPVLILHGELDPVVPVEQAYLLHQTLQAAGVRSELVMIRNAGHGLEPLGGPISPTYEEILQQALIFLDTTLGQ
jgi:acetyl esterase/lipase